LKATKSTSVDVTCCHSGQTEISAMTVTDQKDSPFVAYLRSVQGEKVFVEPLAGNNGDALILMGLEHVISKTGLSVVRNPREAGRILVNGGGAMSDVWLAGFDVIARYRREYPHVPVVVGPSTFRFRGFDFGRVSGIGRAPLILFARDRISQELATEAAKEPHVSIRVSDDLAFELGDTDFIRGLTQSSSEQHVLVAMRKDREGRAKILAKAKGTWLPKVIRRPLSKIRDRLVAKRSGDIIEQIINQQGVEPRMRRLCRDVSVSVSFHDFVATVRDAALIITDRLHVGILGHLLNKKTVLFDSEYHKIRGVYEMSMSGQGTRTVLWS
jgi:exopolysaccharide biosynthesis predicted pyruvyltransferase EpsI